MSDPDDEVPPHLWRLTMYYHDLVSIKWAWESLGNPFDPALQAELMRAHDRLLKILEEESGQGGTFHNLARRIADEAGQSPDGAVGPQGGTTIPRGESRRY